MKTSLATVEGQIISAHSYDELDVSVIELWVKSSPQDNQKSKLSHTVTQVIIEEQRPVFFIRSSDSVQVRHLLRQQAQHYQVNFVDLKTFKQQAVAAVYSSNLHYFYQARKILQSYSERIPLYESDLSLHERFLMERFCYGSITVQGEENNKEHYTKLSQAKIKPSQSDVELNCLSVDIECSAEGELFSIGFSCR